MHVRRARTGDLARAGELTVAAYAPFTLGDHAYIEKLRDTAARSREAELWVAVDGEPEDPYATSGPRGSLTTCPPGSRFREVAREHEGEFRMLAVDPASQGHGIGTALVTHALTVFGHQGFTAAVLSSLPAMTPAHRLYHRHGFVRRPERDWSPAPGIDLVVFDRDL